MCYDPGAEIIFMRSVDRRSFLAGLSSAGASVAAASWLQAIGYAQSRGPARAFLRRAPGRSDFDRSPVRIVPRAPGPRRLHRRVPARLAAGRRQRIPHRRRARDQGTRRADRSVSGRKLRLRLQLARRRRPEERSGRRCSSAPGTHSRRISSGPTSSSTGAAMVGHRAAARDELWHRHRRDGRGLCRVLQRRSRAHAGAICAARTATSGRTTCATGASATRWTAPGRSASCRHASTAARRVTLRSRCGSSIRSCSSSHADRAAPSCRPILSGTAKCSKSATTRSTASRFTPTTATQRSRRATARARYLAMNLDMDRHIHEVAAVCDYVQGLQSSPKRLWLSFDEWNVWYRARGAQASDGQRHCRAPAARRGLQPRGRAPRRRLRQHPAAQCGSRPDCVPRATRQRHRAARDQ